MTCNRTPDGGLACTPGEYRPIPTSMTYREAITALLAIGMVIRRTDGEYDGEYMVNFRGGEEATAYYTNDIDDAVMTAKDMAKRQSSAAQRAIQAKYPSAYSEVGYYPDGRARWTIWLPTSRPDAPYQMGWGETEEKAWIFAAHDRGIAIQEGGAL